MIKVRVEVPDDLLGEYQNAAQRFPALVERGFRRQLTRIGGKAVKTLATYPPKPKPGITKKMTPKQRRAFWATNGFGHGIPYVRSGKLGEGWKYSVDKLDKGGGLTVYNSTRYGRFVQGDDAQPFHISTGWTQAAPVLARVREDAETQLTELWVTLADEFAGVR